LAPFCLQLLSIAAAYAGAMSLIKTSTFCAPYNQCTV